MPPGGRGWTAEVESVDEGDLRVEAIPSRTELAVVSRSVIRTGNLG